MAISKKDRLKVYAKYAGHCAYCGVKLKEKGWRLDHIKPLYRGNAELFKHCNDTVGNANPSCVRCNSRKSVYSIEQFRNQISKQVERLRRDSSAFRMAEDFGLIKEVKAATIKDALKPVIFYFEKQKQEKNDERRKQDGQRSDAGIRQGRNRPRADS